ncbi:hypothetical protein, partial [Reinekea sp.]|uniref:hypothetical protein n=1 Tax=Reinekea sp. TaxID=1970455 RepID=UPI0039893080
MSNIIANHASLNPVVLFIILLFKRMFLQSPFLHVKLLGLYLMKLSLNSKLNISYLLIMGKAVFL